MEPSDPNKELRLTGADWPLTQRDRRTDAFFAINPPPNTLLKPNTLEDSGSRGEPCEGLKEGRGYAAEGRYPRFHLH